MIDLAVIGGGINGSGIARDAAGRGLKVALIESRDLAAGTSSASSKLIHGGLRYLEQGELRLVRESLDEREVLLAAAPHLVWPLRFVLPVAAGMRPAWMIRLGLFLYDRLGRRRRLAGSRTVPPGDAVRQVLREPDRAVFEYSDCWAEDARLVVANALDAQQRGADIEVGWSAESAQRRGGHWEIQLRDAGGRVRALQARAIVNTAGPWVQSAFGGTLTRPGNRLRLVKGSHIVTDRLYPGDQAYTLQNPDGRVIFLIPFEDRFTLIGTTDVPYTGDPQAVRADAEEINYLCEAASRWLRHPVTPEAVVWTYSGVRPLHDDGSVSASQVTRDYVFDVDAPAGGAPLLTVYGGKLTTYRRLAEHALSKLLPHLGCTARAWTRTAVLPGGEFGDDLARFTREQQAARPFLPAAAIARLCRTYGTRIEQFLGGVRDLGALGEHFGADLYEAELDYLRHTEWTRTAEAALWRRTKLGLALTPAQRSAIARWFGDDLAIRGEATAGVMPANMPA